MNYYIIGLLFCTADAATHLEMGDIEGFRITITPESIVQINDIQTIIKNSPIIKCINIRDVFDCVPVNSEGEEVELKTTTTILYLKVYEDSVYIYMQDDQNGEAQLESEDINPLF